MHLVVCYDVVENKRRNKLFKGLCAFVQPVQKSVFEGLLPSERYPEMLNLINRTIDHETDTVRIYHLCRGCQGLMDLIGSSPAIELEPEDIII